MLQNPLPFIFSYPQLTNVIYVDNIFFSPFLCYNNVDINDLKKADLYIIMETNALLKKGHPVNPKTQINYGDFKMESTFSHPVESHPVIEKWKLIKETIRKEYELSNISYSTWIEPLTLYKVENDDVYIIIPADKAHAINYISNKYTSFFQVTITEMMDKNYTVSFILEKDIESDSDQENSDNKSIYNIIYERANLNPKYKFDTFVVGSNNRFAHR